MKVREKDFTEKNFIIFGLAFFLIGTYIALFGAMYKQTTTLILTSVYLSMLLSWIVLKYKPIFETDLNGHAEGLVFLLSSLMGIFICMILKEFKNFNRILVAIITGWFIGKLFVSTINSFLNEEWFYGIMIATSVFMGFLQLYKGKNMYKTQFAISGSCILVKGIGMCLKNSFPDHYYEKDCYICD